MLKKILCFGIIMIGLNVTDVLGAPTVRKLGTATSVSGSANVVGGVPASAENKTVTPSARTTTIAPRTAIKVSPGIKTASRLPMVNVNPVKTVNTGGVKVINSETIKNSASEEDLRAVTERVQALEDQTDDITKNTVREVVVKNDGTYVTDVDKEGDELHVTKTYLLHAPIRNAGDQDIKGTAEIWVEK